ncbi:MAG: EamA family transporter, partial [Alphaproteobacteria bacterium]
ALAGILHFVWGRYWNYRAVKEMGANLSGPVQQLSLLVALTFAVILLDEKLTVLRVIGIALVVLGPAIMTRRAPPLRGGSREHINGFRPNMVAGYTAALMATLGYGLSPILVRAGLADTGLSLAGGLISYVSATMAVALILLLPGRAAHILGVDRGAAKWFTISGVFVFFAQMFRYLALAIAPVTVVAPIQRLSLVFRVGLSTVLNPEHEVFDARVVIGVVVSLLGMLALTLSVEFIGEFLALPRWVITWRWP